MVDARGGGGGRAGMFVDCVLSEKFPLDGMLCCTCFLSAVLVYNQTSHAEAEGLRPLDPPIILTKTRLL